MPLDFNFRENSKTKLNWEIPAECPGGVLATYQDRPRSFDLHSLSGVLLKNIPTVLLPAISLKVINQEQHDQRNLDTSLSKAAQLSMTLNKLRFYCILFEFIIILLQSK